MKKALSIILLFFGHRSFSQTPVTYSEVISIDSISKAELYVRAKMTFINVFKSSKDVIQMDDKENGSIIGKALFTYSPTIFIGSALTRGVVRYSISIQVKDGRYKYEITDFRHTADKSTSDMSMGLITTAPEAPEGIRPYERKWANNIWMDIKTQSKQQATNLIQMIINEMNKPTSAESEEDW